MTQRPDIRLDLDAARAAITAIRRFDLEAVSIDDLKEALIPVFRGYAVSAPRFEPGLELFRARLMAKPQHVRELLYPPAGATPMGRANREGDSVLYRARS
jgi:hypothetical protein